MSELSREYLDKQLNSQTTELKSYVGEKIVGLDEKIDSLARMTANGLAEIKRELDVREQVEGLNKRIFRIEQALNIKN